MIVLDKYLGIVVGIAFYAYIFYRMYLASKDEKHLKEVGITTTGKLISKTAYVKTRRKDGKVDSNIVYAFCIECKNLQDIPFTVTYEVEAKYRIEHAKAYIFVGDEIDVLYDELDYSRNKILEDTWEAKELRNTDLSLDEKFSLKSNGVVIKADVIDVMSYSYTQVTLGIERVTTVYDMFLEGIFNGVTRRYRHYSTRKSV